MTATGFGQRVTGGGANPTILRVRNGDNKGAETLFAALERARVLPATRIVIQSGITIKPNELIIQAKNLTITAEANTLIDTNELHFDCRFADNVLLQNLHFRGTPAKQEGARDAIFLDGLRGRQPVGFWIDHCLFDAYYDLNITAKTPDISGAPPLLLTISSCRFRNENPNGEERRNNGAIGIAGGEEDGPDNRTTNTYATVTRNLFETVRRRSPRSSGLTIAHAFNNVLRRWGAENTDDQVNGMEAGHAGFLIAAANFFVAGPVKEAISVARDPRGNLTVNKTDARLRNVYRNDAIEAEPSGQQVDIDPVYRSLGLTAPAVLEMTDTVRQQVEAEAGLFK